MLFPASFLIRVIIQTSGEIPCGKNSIISLWQQLATLYNGNPTVAGYDLINEPRQNFNYAEVIRFQVYHYQAIRAIDSTHVCMVECIDNDMFAMMLPLNYTEYSLFSAWIFHITYYTSGCSRRIFSKCEKYLSSHYQYSQS
jgi:hypothetical protein